MGKGVWGRSPTDMRWPRSWEFSGHCGQTCKEGSSCLAPAAPTVKHTFSATRGPAAPGFGSRPCGRERDGHTGRRQLSGSSRPEQGGRPPRTTPPNPARRRDQDTCQGWPHRAGLAASRHGVPWAGRCPAQGTDHHLGVPARSSSLAVLSALAAATETQSGAPTTVQCPGPGIGRSQTQACAGLAPLASLLGEWTPSSPRVLTHFPSVHVPMSSSRGDTGQIAWGPP